MKRRFVAATAVLAICVLALTNAAAQSLRAGAAKVDITPAEDELPQNYLGILDRIHSRAIVIDDGESKAALISVDAGGIADNIWQAVTAELDRDLGIPVTNVMITATHTHSVPRQPGDDYVDKIVDSVRLASQRLEPARAGFGSGLSYINVNRNRGGPQGLDSLAAGIRWSPLVIGILPDSSVTVLR